LLPVQFRASFRNLFWLNLEKILRIVLGVVQSGLVARAIGPENFGVLNSALALAAICCALSAAGLDSVLIRRFVDRDNPAVLGTALMIRGLFGAVVFVSLLLLLPIVGSDPVERRVIIVVSTMALVQPLGVFHSWLQAEMLHRRVAQAQIAGFFIALVLRFYCAIHSYGVTAFAIIAVAEFAFGLFVALLTYLRRAPSSEFVVAGGLVKSLLRESWPLVVASVAVSLCLRVDLLIIRTGLGETHAGEYAAAVRLSEAFQFLGVAIVSLLTPIFLRLRREKLASYRRDLPLIMSFCTWLGFTIAVVLTITSAWLVPLIYGRGFTLSSSALQVHAWTNVTTFSGMAWMVYWLAECRQRESMLIALGGAAFTILLATLWVPRFGLTGAALSALAGQLAPFALLMLWRDPRDLFFAHLRGLLTPLRAGRAVYQQLFSSA
jgi:O-antigen/teichoic acid export membrane protein